MATNSNYKPFLIQKLTDGAAVEDSLDWNMYVKHVPFKPVGDIKEPFKRNWPDQNGNEVHYPANPVYEGYDMECEFVYMGDENTATPMIKLFVYHLAQGGMFNFFDTYTQIGKTNVNYKSMSPEIYRNDSENISVFKLVLTVNDPVTDVILERSTT